jgi:hypothetical protein
MKLIALVVLIFFISLDTSAKSQCTWCILNDLSLHKNLVDMIAIDAKTLLQKIRSEKVCVKILDSHRKVPEGFFHWDQVEHPSEELSTITKLPALMGKTLCADELPLAKGCVTIGIASDAPKTTLIHEYLHVQQIKKDSAWCAVSKSLWGKKALSEDERQAQSDREWDVVRVLWAERERTGFSLEDKITIAGDLLEQAAARKSFDADAQNYVRTQKVDSYLMSHILEYRQKPGKK